MIYAYIRVSTDKQTVENQRFEINDFCLKNNLTVSKYIEETISGTVDVNKRKLGKLLKRLKPNDILIASEISRLGRNILQVMNILHLCMSKNIQVWTIKDNYRLGTDIASKVLAFAFSLSAEIERTLLSQRTKEALRRRKLEGKQLGRITGSQNLRHKLDGKEHEILQLLNQGVSKNKIAHMFAVNIKTLNKFLKLKVLNNL